jgi:Amino acid permease
VDEEVAERDTAGSEGERENAVLAEALAGRWGKPGQVFIWLTLAAETALLFVAAQAGFIDGPRVMSNMANDSWLPLRFGQLSDRLSMQHGILLISLASVGTLLYTRGDTTTLVLMYSINVFLTFSLSESGMVRYWFREPAKYPEWKSHISIHLIGLVLCVSILTMNVIEKFSEGGWITLAVTALLIWPLFCHPQPLPERPEEPAAPRRDHGLAPHARGG